MLAHVHALQEPLRLQKSGSPSPPPKLMTWPPKTAAPAEHQELVCIPVTLRTLFVDTVYSAALTLYGLGASSP
jgi:hypothetical protein